MQETLILVDENDNEVGHTEKLKAHEHGMLHRAFSIFIFRLAPSNSSSNGNKEELLLQQRHQDKYHCGSLWTNTCCGHPCPGENILAAAERRLSEELLFNTTLTPIGKFHYYADCNNGLIEHELDHVFVGVYNQEVKQVNPAEIQAVRWFTLDETMQELTQFPERFTPWFAKALTLVKEHQAEITHLLHCSINSTTIKKENYV